MSEFDHEHFIRKLESLEERQQKQALEVSEGLSALKSLVEENKRLSEESLKDSEVVTNWMNGSGDTGGAKVRLALLEEREKRRDYWVKIAVGIGISCLIAIFVTAIRAIAAGMSG